MAPYLLLLLTICFIHGLGMLVHHRKVPMSPVELHAIWRWRHSSLPVEVRRGLRMERDVWLL